MLVALVELSSRLFGLTRDSDAASKFNESAAQDIESLDTTIKQVSASVGEPIPIGGNMDPNLWTALDSLYEKLNDNDAQVQNKLKSLTKVIDLMDKFFARHKSQQTKYWQVIKDLITRINTLLRKEELHPLDNLSTRIHSLEMNSQPPAYGQPHNAQHFQSKQERRGSDDSETFAEFLHNLGSPNQHRPVPPAQPMSMPSQSLDLTNLMERMKELEDALETIADRASSEGVSFGQFVFHTPRHLSDWIGTQLKGYRYGYFVDGVSIWQFFFTDHRDTDAITSSVDKHVKAGYATFHEAYVSVSFQNTLPTLLGKGDQTDYLPALRTFDKWDKGDTSGGLRIRISRELTGVQRQIEKYIRNLDSISEARLLAQDCLTHSVRFVTELSAYITRAHQQLSHSKTYNTQQAWNLVARCVKRCFTDMSDARITAKDARDHTNPLATATEYIWATLRTHQVMEEYLQKNFEDHPAFSSVITSFVTNNNITSNVSEVSSKADKVEKDIKAYKKAFGCSSHTN